MREVDPEAAKKLEKKELCKAYPNEPDAGESASSSSGCGANGKRGDPFVESSQAEGGGAASGAAASMRETHNCCGGDNACAAEKNKEPVHVIDLTLVQDAPLQVEAVKKSEKYLGVQLTNHGTWQATCTDENGNLKIIGSYSKESDAAEARDKVVPSRRIKPSKEYFGVHSTNHGTWQATCADANGKLKIIGNYLNEIDAAEARTKWRSKLESSPTGRQGRDLISRTLYAFARNVL